MKIFKGSICVLLFQLTFSINAFAEPETNYTINLSDGLQFPILVDMEAELIFPMKLSGMITLEPHFYDNPDLGYSLRYAKDEWSKVDIYVYNLGLPEIPNGPNSEAVKKESRSVSRIISSMQDDDRYTNVKKLGKTTTPMSGKTRFIKESYQYTQDGSGRLSESYITGYNNHFIKIRFTYAEKRRSEAKKVAKELLEGLVGLMESNHDEKTMALAAISVFLSDPSSKAARASIQGAVDYAIETEVFTISIPAEIFPWTGNEVEIENSELLITAYFAGVMSFIVPNELDRGGEVEGFTEMLTTYQALREKDEIQKISELDAWLLEDDKMALFHRIADKP